MKFNAVKLYDLLIENCMTVKKLSEISGLSIFTIYNAAKGERVPRRTTVGKIAKALGIDYHDLIIETESK